MKIITIQVRFVGEGAVDYGGPRREFFRLLASAAQQTFLVGSHDYKFFGSNVSAIQVIISVSSLM